MSNPSNLCSEPKGKAQKVALNHLLGRQGSSSAPGMRQKSSDAAWQPAHEAYYASGSPEYSNTTSMPPAPATLPMPGAVR